MDWVLWRTDSNSDSDADADGDIIFGHYSPSPFRPVVTQHNDQCETTVAAAARSDDAAAP